MAIFLYFTGMTCHFAHKVLVSKHADEANEYVEQV